MYVIKNSLNLMINWKELTNLIIQINIQNTSKLLRCFHNFFKKNSQIDFAFRSALTYIWIIISVG